MILPNFLIVGAQKSGTTTLYDILNNHPGVNMSKVKEINYFTSKRKQSKGIEYYSSFFKPQTKTQKITGEASPGYMNNLNVPKTIKKELGPIKIVMILRDPVKRAFSQYWDNRRHLTESLTENEIVSKYLTSNYSTKSRGYFSRGVYIKYIEEYLKYFDRKNIHIMIFENLINNPNDELKELFNFLEIENSSKFLKINKSSNPSMIWNNVLYNFFLNNPFFASILPKHSRKLLFFGKKTAYKYSLPNNENLKILQEFYKPWNEKLEDFLGIKLTCWKLSNPQSKG